MAYCCLAIKNKSIFPSQRRFIAMFSDVPDILMTVCLGFQTDGHGYLNDNGAIDSIAKTKFLNGHVTLFN